jgi:cell division protein FtsB
MKHRRSGFYIVTGLILSTLLIYAVVSLAKMNERIETAEAVRDTLAAQAQDLAVGNASLEYEIEHCDDLDMVERVARDKLGLVLPGEIIYYDIGG